jgi:hypothetical protein
MIVMVGMLICDRAICEEAAVRRLDVAMEHTEAWERVVVAMT